MTWQQFLTAKCESVQYEAMIVKKYFYVKPLQQGT